MIHINTVQQINLETLADFVREIIREKELSLRQIEKNSNFTISNSYISKLLSGAAANFSLEKIWALAEGLKVPKGQVFAAVCGVTVKDLAFLETISFYIKEMPEYRQQDLLDIAKLFFTKGRNNEIDSTRGFNDQRLNPNALDYSKGVQDLTKDNNVLNFATGASTGKPEQSNESEDFGPEEDEFGNDPVLDEFIEKHLKNKTD